MAVDGVRYGSEHLNAVLRGDAQRLFHGQVESHGYLQRVPDPTDRRAKLVLPTERGLEVIAVAQSIAPVVEQQINALVGADRMRALQDDLETIRRAVTRA